MIFRKTPITASTSLKNGIPLASNKDSDGINDSQPTKSPLSDSKKVINSDLNIENSPHKLDENIKHTFSESLMEMMPQFSACQINNNLILLGGGGGAKNSGIKSGIVLCRYEKEKQNICAYDFNETNDLLIYDISQSPINQEIAVAMGANVGLFKYTKQENEFDKANDDKYNLSLIETQRADFLDKTGANSFLSHLCYSNDQSKLATAGDDNLIRIWKFDRENYKTPKLCGVFPYLRKKFDKNVNIDGDVSINDICWHPNDEFFAAVYSSLNYLFIFSLHDRQIQQSIDCWKHLKQDCVLKNGKENSSKVHQIVVKKCCFVDEKTLIIGINLTTTEKRIKSDDLKQKSSINRLFCKKRAKPSRSCQLQVFKFTECGENKELNNSLKQSFWKFDRNICLGPKNSGECIVKMVSNDKLLACATNKSSLYIFNKHSLEFLYKFLNCHSLPITDICFDKGYYNEIEVNKSADILNNAKTVILTVSPDRTFFTKCLIDPESKKNSSLDSNNDKDKPITNISLKSFYLFQLWSIAVSLTILSVAFLFLFLFCFYFTTSYNEFENNIMLSGSGQYDLKSYFLKLNAYFNSTKFQQLHIFFDKFLNSFHNIFVLLIERRSFKHTLYYLQIIGRQLERIGKILLRI